MGSRQGETAFCALFLYVNEGGEGFHQTPLYELFGKDQQFFLTDPISPFSKQILLSHAAEAPVFGKPEGGVRQGCLWAQDASQRRAPASWRERRPWRQRGLWRIGGAMWEEFPGHSKRDEVRTKSGRLFLPEWASDSGAGRILAPFCVLWWEREKR